jgi:hypothetical protein
MWKQHKAFFVKFFIASFALFFIWQSPKLVIVDNVLKRQPLAFDYSHISGGFGELVLHNVIPKGAPDLVLPRVAVSPSYLSLFTGEFVADVNADVAEGTITGTVDKPLFSKNISMDLAFNDIMLSPDKGLLEKTIFKNYLDGVKTRASGKLSGDLASTYWPDTNNKMQLTFTLSGTELALKNLGMLQAGEVNGTLSMQDGAMFADINTLDDNKGFNFALDGRTALRARLAESLIAGDVKLSFLGGNETHKKLGGSLLKPRLMPIQ